MHDIGVLRDDLFNVISEIGFLPSSLKPSDPCLNCNSDNNSLLKAIILGGLWPRVARVHLPRKAIKYDQVQAGTVRRENVAREFQLFDVGEQGMRVFTHPASVMFSEISGKSSFVVYFNKQQTTKVFLRDATEVCSLHIAPREVYMICLCSPPRCRCMPFYCLADPCK